MTETTITLGMTIQKKNPSQGDTFIKSDVTIKLDDTKPVADQLAWWENATKLAWDRGSELLGAKLAEEELIKNEARRNMVVDVLQNHKEQLDAINAEMKRLTQSGYAKRK